MYLYSSYVNSSVFACSSSSDAMCSVSISAQNFSKTLNGGATTQYVVALGHSMPNGKIFHGLDCFVIQMILHSILFGQKKSPRVCWLTVPVFHLVACKASISIDFLWVSRTLSPQIKGSCLQQKNRSEGLSEIRPFN